MLDRDGTLIRHVHHLTDPNLVELLPGVGVALKNIQSAGFKLGVVTNQSVIGRGLASLARVGEVNARMQEQLLAFGVTISQIKICPHVPNDNCKCRKPLPLLGQELLADDNFSPELSFMVGDQESDLEFGRNLGIQSILISSSELVAPPGTIICKDWAGVEGVVLSR